MKTRYFLPGFIALLMLCLAPGCSKDNLPDGLEFSVLENPSPLPLINEGTALVYEIRVKNSSIDSYTFESVSVKDGAESILELAGNELDTLISIYHSHSKTLKAGETAFFFMWVEPAPNLPMPGSLAQTIQFNRVSDGKQYTTELKVQVGNMDPVVLAFPLHARRYATPGAPANDSYHRRTINFLDDKFWTSERYAVDFIGLDAGNRYRAGMQNENLDYFGYEDIVYSATAGEIVSIIDTIADNKPPIVPDIDPAALYRARGNQVVVKVSAGVYVFYGHLVRASIDLTVGDRVEVGQPLGRLGNSGNCDAPQLHLAVMDGADPLRSNGIPWVFDQFILHGSISGYDYINGLIRVDYLTIQQKIQSKNLSGDAVVSIE